MREDNLLAIQPRAFVVTTDSGHDLEVYLNLASRMKLTGINQLWVADITYIRLHREFVYLAVILDAFSRKVVGWALDERWQRACRSRRWRKQFQNGNRRRASCIIPIAACSMPPSAYVAILREHNMIPSMSRPANPYDNASCESFMKTLKHEEIYANDYRDLDHLRANIEDFIERYYNRLPLAFGARLPATGGVRASHTPPGEVAGATMSFFRHREIYRSDVDSLAKLGSRPKLPLPGPSSR